MKNKTISLKEFLRKNSGITLISLVVTILILIILSSITINTVLGDNGIINVAKDTNDKIWGSIDKENDKMNKVLSEYTNIMGGGVDVPIPPTDTEGPKVDIVVGVKTENSIEVTVNATDESGIATYEYYLNSEETPRATSTSNSYTYTGLTGGESYTIKVVVTDNAGNSTTVTKVEKTNAVPGAPTVTFNSKTTNSITVQAKSTDADGEELTYTLYMSTSSTGNYEEKATATGSSGNNVSLTASGLSQYTTYYYYVTVTDQISNNQSITANQRTYCPGTGHTGTYCSGGTTTTANCSNCGGMGAVCMACGGMLTTQSEGNGYWGYVCTRKGSYNCMYGYTDPEDCSVCNGTGKVEKFVNCSHGYSSSHYYCTTHNYVGSVSNHCVHGKTVQHDS